MISLLDRITTLFACFYRCVAKCEDQSFEAMG